MSICLFIVVACAATLHVNGITINDASDAAGALKPLAGHLAAMLSGFLSQALNAILLLLILPFMRRLAQDPAVMATTRWGPAGKLTTGITLALIAASATALAVLSVA